MKAAEIYREKAEILLILRDMTSDPQIQVDYGWIARQWSELAARAERDEKIADELEHLREMWNVK